MESLTPRRLISIGLLITVLSETCSDMMVIVAFY